MFINQNNLNNHYYFMSLALAQAQKNLGNTKENPSVGCVIVKDNSVVSAGCTSVNGRPHAEQNAINFSKSNLKNSTLYVTLEPCSHFGKTSPCTNAIIKNKIKNVFFSINDPDLRSFNKCQKLLKIKKINVNLGICRNESELFYRSYIKSKKSYLPFVTCKLAVSKDYYTVNKQKKWITNNFSRSRVHLMRSNHDCIITSSKTINKDNSRLTCRIKGFETSTPARIIIDNELKIQISSNIIKDAIRYPTIIFYNKFNKKKFILLKKFKVRLYKIPVGTDNNLSLYHVLTKAKQLGFYRIFLEAGKELSFSFLQQNLVDDLKIFISNKNLEKNGMHNVKKKIKFFIKNKKCIEEKVNLFGERLLTYYIT